MSGFGFLSLLVKVLGLNCQEALGLGDREKGSVVRVCV